VKTRQPTPAGEGWCQCTRGGNCTCSGHEALPRRTGHGGGLCSTWHDDSHRHCTDCDCCNHCTLSGGASAALCRGHSWHHHAGVALSLSLLVPALLRFVPSASSLILRRMCCGRMCAVEVALVYGAHILPPFYSMALCNTVSWRSLGLPGAACSVQSPQDPSCTCTCTCSVQAALPAMLSQYMMKLTAPHSSSTIQESFLN
jgi:hypothetical protein